jgi:hypothetical protein
MKIINLTKKKKYEKAFNHFVGSCLSYDNSLCLCTAEQAY